MAHYLVTGGAGFIGSHIAETLLRKGEEVTVLDNLSSGKKETFALLKKISPKVRCIEGDILDSPTLKKAMQGVEVVFHQAAMGSVPRSVEDPLATHAANATGTLLTLFAAKEAKVKRFVNAASSSAYGDTPELPKRESMPANPFSPYAASKLAQENYCRAFAVSYGMETVSLRYFNVYGPRQDPESQYAAVVPNFFTAYLRNKRPKIYGDGEQTRDLTYVSDVVEANLAAARVPKAEGNVYNIAGGRRISINELAGTIAERIGSKLIPEHRPARAGDIRHSLADIQRAKEDLGWVPRVTLEEGLRLSLDWYRSYVPAE